jgi:hypothetical protein
MRQPIRKDDAGYYIEVPGPKLEGDVVKPGKKTTEATAAILALIGAYAASKGYLSPDDADAAVKATEALVGQIGTVAVPMAYGLFRTIVKVVSLWRGGNG